MTYIVMSVRFLFPFSAWLLKLHNIYNQNSRFCSYIMLKLTFEDWAWSFDPLQSGTLVLTSINDSTKVSHTENWNFHKMGLKVNISRSGWQKVTSPEEYIHLLLIHLLWIMYILSIWFDQCKSSFLFDWLWNLIICLTIQSQI